jgi:hypothetical protein
MPENGLPLTAVIPPGLAALLFAHPLSRIWQFSLVIHINKVGASVDNFVH